MELKEKIKVSLHSNIQAYKDEEGHLWCKGHDKCINEIINITNQETASLRKELEEKEKRIVGLKEDFELVFKDNQDFHLTLSAAVNAVNDVLNEERAKSAKLVEALNAIATQKLITENDNDTYRYNRSWHFAVDALAEYEKGGGNGK